MTEVQDIQTIADRFMNVETAHVCDALVHVGVLTPVLTDRLRPFTGEQTFAGPAVTLKLARSRWRNDQRRLNEFVEQAVKPGDVLLVDVQGMLDSTVFGDRAAWVAQNNGAVGAVIHGGIRDVDDLEKLRLPVHAVGRSLPASEERLQGVGIDCEVIIDGVLVRPGDWLVGDSSGICVVPEELVERVLELAEEREEIDDQSLVDLKAGKTLREVHRHFKDDDVEQIQRTE